MTTALRGTSMVLHIIDQKYVETEAEKKARQKLQEDIINTKPPYSVGSVDSLNQDLKHYNEELRYRLPLVCEKKAIVGAQDSSSENTRLNSPNCSFLATENQNTGFNDNSNPCKNGTPRLIETCVFPGFQKHQVTSLPYNIQPKEMLKKALHAHYSTIGSLQRPTFEKILYSKRCQDILQDIFWYLFLTNFQPDLSVQQKLFHRVAVNYVNLIDLARRAKYFADTLFKELPKLMSLAVYGTFQHSFPDSHCQFDNVFKQSVIELIWLWMTGIKPIPSFWKNWNFDLLQLSAGKIPGETSKKWRKTVPELNRAKLDHHLTVASYVATAGENVYTKQLISMSICQRKTSRNFPIKWLPQQETSEKTGNIGRSIFNTTSCCPLVDHFLRSKDASIQVGGKHFVRRS
ncbi:Hypothetical predicted protein [Octopus vulgaris]|uniref:Protein FAM227B n=1 Tax=Octopus vulgaris TaxID=6645 RepID=A0AA36FP67_OCTVU|nr:Hypothetical predicted protein [Octopus vulgaris]